MEDIALLRNMVVVSEAGCWLWLGDLTADGYGRFNPETAHRSGLAHRAAYEIVNGPIPKGLVLDHRCRARACCNPDHLEAVSQRENLMRAPTSLAAINAAKTHCPAGHPLSGKNLYRHSGRRFCRQCRKAASARHKLGRRQSLARQSLDSTSGRSPVA